MEDLGRYASSVGWEPKDPWKKLREKAREQYAKDLAVSLSYNESMLEVRPASRWITPPSQQRPRRELFGPLWREGEVAILFGPKSSGKSLLAVQLAEDLARGTRTLLSASSPPSAHSSLTTHHSSLAPPVLLIDFELSEQQFTERYTQPPAFPGRRARRTRFKFKRAALQWDGRVPEAFRGNVNKFLQHSIQTAIEQSEAKIIIIDSLNHLPRNMSNAAGAVSMMKNLKHQAARQGLSILVLANSKDRGRPRPLLSPTGYRLPATAYGTPRPMSLRDISAPRSITEIADTVFALGTSTFGPEFRYIKHLASRSTPIAPDADVLTYSLAAIKNGKVRIENSSENSPLTIHNSPFSFTFLGPSQESDHLRDYQREAYEQDRAHHREIKKIARLSAKEAIVEGFMDGSYGRYLNS